MIIGRIAFSSKLPCDPAIATAVSFPITCMQTIIIASSCVGFTFPGIIEDPGSFAGRLSSCKPARGPDPNHRISFAIFISATASDRRAALALTIGSSDACAVNLFGAVKNGCPVSRAISDAIFSPNPAGALSPVPTAVPPAASLYNPLIDILILSRTSLSCTAYPDHSCPTVSGVASCK